MSAVRRARGMDILVRPSLENTIHHKVGKAILSPVQVFSQICRWAAAWLAWMETAMLTVLGWQQDH